jgi:hypothetical protein
MGCPFFNECPHAGDSCYPCGIEITCPMYQLNYEYKSNTYYKFSKEVKKSEKSKSKEFYIIYTQLKRRK